MASLSTRPVLTFETTQDVANWKTNHKTPAIDVRNSSTVQLSRPSELVSIFTTSDINIFYDFRTLKPDVSNSSYNGKILL